MSNASVEGRFGAALSELVEEIKQDRSVLAAILCGSLSHDTVWAKSDIDLALVTVDDPKVKSAGVALYSNGVNVHVFMLSRADFRQTVEGSLRNSFEHSLLVKGRLLYTHDDTVARLFESLKKIGARDTQIQLLHAGSSALPPIYKAHKWMVTRGDLDYTALWILYAATPLAQIEVIGAGQVVDREVIPQAMKLNPAFFERVYVEMLNGRKTRARVQAALDAVDGYVAERAPALFALVLEHLREVGEARSATELADWFKRNYGVGDVTTACEYLSDRGLIGKAGAPVKLTRRSNVHVQELAFFHLGETADGW
jgi:predicted nucleotidyltransferase